MFSMVSSFQVSNKEKRSRRGGHCPPEGSESRYGVLFNARFMDSFRLAPLSGELSAKLTERFKGFQNRTVFIPCAGGEPLRLASLGTSPIRGGKSLHDYNSTVAILGSKQQHGRMATTRTPLARCGPTFMKVASTEVPPPRPSGPVSDLLTSSVMYCSISVC